MNMENSQFRLEKPDFMYAQALLDYQKRNIDFLTPFVPKRELSFFTLEYQKKVLDQKILFLSEQKEYCFYIFDNINNNLIGSLSLSNIIRGAFQSCFLGYSLDKDYLNRGIMSKSICFIVKFAFNELKLHRIEANVMPRNIPSRKVLEKNNFIEEGFSKQYMLINNKWEDHIHYVLINQDYLID